MKVFASSLLNLISPWARSPAGRCPRSVARALRAPALPPPPRRLSDPTTQNTPNIAQKHFRRHSDMKNPKSELDLRQELINVNLNNCEVDSWLGRRFDQVEGDEEDFRFNHDIPLQRSISVDRGLDIFNYLQTIGSNTSDSFISTSTWTVSSTGNTYLRVEGYSSVGDIPASPSEVKSRRVSLDATNTITSKSNSVLRNSCTSIDEESGNIPPLTRKLRRTFSFKNVINYKMAARRYSIESENGTPTAAVETAVPIPLFRSVTLDTKDAIEEGPRQRRIGVTTNEWDMKAETRDRNEALTKYSLGRFKSYDELIALYKDKQTVSNPNIFKQSFKGVQGSDSLDIRRRLKKSFSNRYPYISQITVPKIIIINSDVCNDNIIKDNDGPELRKSSSVDDIDVSCCCEICIGTNDKEKGSFLKRSLSRIFLRIIAYKDFGKKIFWDERNEIRESEMFTCIIYLLKWMLGLWLRHLDHKHQEVCAS